MGFAWPLGLLALLALPAIAALHLFRRRFRPLEVSALFLWREEQHTLEAGRRPEPLRATPSLWLELLAAALLALALAGPRLPWLRDAEHLVCVLDASASMGARAPQRTSVRDRALDALATRIDELPADSLVTVVASGPRPRVLVGPLAFPAQAKDALDAYRPRAGRHDLEPALALGRELAGGGAVLLVTDHEPAPGLPADLELLALGEPLDNVGIVHAARTRAATQDEPEAKERLLVSVEALTRAPVERELTVVAGDETLHRRTLALAPDERVHLAFDVAPGTGDLVVRLAADALAIDDRAELAAPPLRPLALASTLDPAEAVLLGLASAGAGTGIDRWLALVPDARAAVDARAADLAVGPAPVDGERTWSLVLEARAGAGTDDWVGPFLAERHHPLLDGTTLEGVVWSADGALRLPGRPLVTVGDRPLMTEERLPDRRIVRLNLDPARSTLQRSPDWPILLANLAELRRAELPGPVRANVGLDEPFVHRDVGPGEVRVRSAAREGAEGDAPRVAVQRDLVVTEHPAPGLWIVERDGRELSRFGVLFQDAAESDLRGASSGARAAETARAAAAGGASPLDTLLLVVALGAIACDWWVLRARARRPAGTPKTTRRS